MRQISYLCLATGCFSRNRGLHPPQYLTICLSIDLSVYPSIYPVIQLASYQSPNLTIYLIIVSRWVSVHCSFLKVCFVFIYKLLVTIGFFLLFAEAGLSKKNKTKYIILSKVFFPPPSTRPSHFSQNAKSRVLKVEEKKKALSLSLSLSLYGVLLKPVYRFASLPLYPPTNIHPGYIEVLLYTLHTPLKKRGRLRGLREDTHKQVFFSGRTSKVWVLPPPPKTLVAQNHLFYNFFLSLYENGLKWMKQTNKKYQSILIENIIFQILSIKWIFVDRYWPVLNIACNFFLFFSCVSWGSDNFF